MVRDALLILKIQLYARLFHAVILFLETARNYGRLIDEAIEVQILIAALHVDNNGHKSNAR